uniref:Reverse transcriptase domain-containing protein n=1 Tax=Tanacetum cinerariifolium TaxID=118510 RepID=A0A699HXV0_TANCI|nr:hypothetical protein [Tanacetum cinerariifolium]
MFQQGEDSIELINKAMAFLSAVVSRFPPSNNQLITSSKSRNQETIKMVELQFNKFKEDNIRVMLEKGIWRDKLVEPLPEPERTLNQRRCRQNKRVPYDQRNNPPQRPRIVYPPILDINHFHHFLVTLENLYPMSDEPMWAADCVFALTPSSAITVRETTNEFAIKGNIIKIFYHGLSEITQEALNAAAGGIFLYKTPNQAYQLLEDKVLLKLDWAKNQKTKSSLKKTISFADEGSSNSNTNKIMARIDAITLKMEAQYKELQTHAKKTKPDINEDEKPMSREEEAKFMQTFRQTHFYNDYRDRDSNRNNWCSNERSSYNRDNYRSNTDDKPYDLQKQFNDFMKSQ